MLTNLSIVPVSLADGGPLLAKAAPLLAEGGAAGGLGGMLPILLMFVVIYFIVLRPMSKQEKDRKKRVEALKKGDQVVLQGGILGRISNADDPKIAIVELADRVKVRVLKSKIEDLQETVLKAEDAGKKDAPAKKDTAKKDKADDDKAEKSKKADDDKAEKAEKSKKAEKAEKSKKADDKADSTSSDDARKGA